MLNAFATRLLSRNFIIITASLLESCDNDTDKLKFIIAHELAHIKRGHVKMQFVLAPSRIIPWL
jgi:Zn-dependent protease with chaperone function